jgi:hypothetical protein
VRGSRAAPPNTRVLAENAENVSCDLIATSLLASGLLGLFNGFFAESRFGES